MFKYETFELVYLLQYVQVERSEKEIEDDRPYMFPRLVPKTTKRVIQAVKYDDNAPKWYSSIRDYVFKTFPTVDLTEEEANSESIHFRWRANATTLAMHNRRGPANVFYLGTETEFPTDVLQKTGTEFYPVNRVDWLGPKEAFFVYAIDNPKHPQGAGMDGGFAYRELPDGAILVHDFEDTKNYGRILRLP